MACVTRTCNSHSGTKPSEHCSQSHRRRFHILLWLFRQQFLAATTTTKVTSMAHEDIHAESNNHLKIRRQGSSPEMDLKPYSSSKSQGVRAGAPQKRTLTVSAAVLPGLSHEKPASWPAGAPGGAPSQRSPHAAPKLRRSPINLARVSSHLSTPGR